MLGSGVWPNEALAVFESPWFSALAAANVAFMVIRFAQRLRYTSKIYGLRVAAFAAPRWPIGIVINALATVGAARQEAAARLFQKPIAWAKTEHELPELFGEAIHA
jgi:adsorption protein B